jgi:NADH-quinone oxidoreductase subunit H
MDEVLSQIGTFLGSLDWIGGVIKLLVMVVILTFVLVVMGFLTYFERKVAAHMQQRQGPNRTGPLGLLQWVADAVKLMSKEDFAPGGTDRLVFLFAPVLSMFTATAAYAFIPFGQDKVFDIAGHKFGLTIGETPIALIALLALSSLGVYGLIMAGWGSNNKYALLGGLRSAAQVISYEISMGISLIGVLMMSQSFNLNDIARAQGVGAHWFVAGAFNPDALSSVVTANQPGIWFILLQPIAFFTYLISAVAETNRTPFDMPEAEGELVSGYHIEYGAMRFGSFFLAEYINMITVSAIASYCFLGGWQAPIAFLNAPGLEPVWFIIKISFFIFVYYWLRWTLPRVRYDQVMGLTWKVLLPLTLANIFVVSALRAMITYVFNNPPPLSIATLGESWPWLIFIAVELGIFVIGLLAFSRMMARSPTGSSRRPLLVANPTPANMLIPPTTSDGPRGIQPAGR